MTQGCLLKLFWIKALVGQRGNERADALIKKSAEKETIFSRYKLSATRESRKY